MDWRSRIPRVRKLQVARRTVQLAVLAFIIAIPVLGHYGNYLASRELDALMERWDGTLQGVTLGAVDTTMRALPGGERERAGRWVRDDDRALERIQGLRGNAWSAQVSGLSLTDPLAAAESFAASRRVVNVILVSLIVPLAVTLLLGRVFCSWLCPMGLFLELTAKLRGALRFLELPAFNVKFPRATKYLVLVCGLVLAWLWAMPVLGSFYPPAIISREASGAVGALFERAEVATGGWTWAGFSLASVFILGVALFELVVSDRWWCRYVCPGGALYSLLGRYRLVRVRRSDTRCTSCGDCVRVCPMGLAPMADRMGIECDNCGVCISHCGDDALGYTLDPELRARGSKSRKASSVATAVTALALLLSLPATALAHHILGIPHYAYDESYPQAPVITYRTQAGDHEVKMTGYPGRPVPGERTSLHVYLTPAPDGTPFSGTVTLQVLRDGLLGDSEVLYGPVEAEQSEGLYKFFPTFDREDNYMVRIDFSIDGVPWTIDLPMVVGEPGSPLAILAGFGGAVVAALIVLRAVRIKRRRRARQGVEDEVKQGSTGV